METVEEWLHRDLCRMYNHMTQFEEMTDHMIFWGVYCGPTLTMVFPKQLRGLRGISNGG